MALSGRNRRTFSLADEVTESSKEFIREPLWRSITVTSTGDPRQPARRFEPAKPGADDNDPRSGAGRTVQHQPPSAKSGNNVIPPSTKSVVPTT
jgi:hypothetical protein